MLFQRAFSYSTGLFRLVAVFFISLICSVSTASELILNGASNYRDLGKDKFIAALYLEVPSSIYSDIIASPSAKKMEIHLSSHYSKRRWVNLWMQSIAINNSNSQFNALAESLVNVFEHQQGSLEVGDIVTINQTQEGCSYQVNGVTLAAELPTELFNLFVNAWIGKAPPSADFRDILLGQNQTTAALTAQLQNHNPLAERVSAIEAWMIPPEPEIDEAQLLAQQQAAAAAQAEALALAQAEAAKQERDAHAIPSLVAMFTTPDQTPLTVNLAAAEQLTQKALERKEQKVEIASDDTAEISVASVLAIKDYIRSAKKTIHNSLKYPRTAQSRGYEGQVRLNIEVDRSGNLVNVETSQKSKHKTLDRAAIKAVKKAAPYAPIPDSIHDKTLNLSIPFKFQLVER